MITKKKSTMSMEHKESLKDWNRMEKISNTSQVSISQEMEFPMYVMTMATFLKLEKMRAHLDMLVDNEIFQWTPHHGPVNFCSHQWVGCSHPDPQAKQLNCMQEVFKIVMKGELPFRSEQDWDLYRKAREYENNTWELQSEVYPKEAFIASVKNGCVWLDFAAIPQMGIYDCPKIMGKFKEAQQKAINSIPAYVQAVTNFWVMVPPCTHADFGVVCNFASWKSRGWCRVEDWTNEFSKCVRRPLIVEGPHDVWVEDFAVKMTSRAQRPYSVLNGEYTCCRFKHVVNGREIPCDKGKLRAMLRKSVDHKIDILRRAEDWLNYAWFLMLRPAMLDEAGEPSEIPDDKDNLPAFMGRYGFRQDVEGKDTPEHFVFFPLFCAVTEGNLSATKLLLEANIRSM
jgi:hypothetical protein